jgi:excisionase family DNA binding protein
MLTDPIGTADAAKLLGCSPRTVKRLALNGTIPATMVAGVYVFERADIERHAAGPDAEAS